MTKSIYLRSTVLCDGCDGLPEISKLAVLCMKDMGNSDKVDFIDWYKPGVYCLKCLKWRWVYTSQ